MKGASGAEQTTRTTNPGTATPPWTDRREPAPPSDAAGPGDQAPPDLPHAVGAHHVRCLVVNGDPLARSVLMHYAEEVPLVHVLGTCADVGEAVAALRALDVDLLLLDVHLPDLSGLDALPRRPITVLTSNGRRTTRYGLDFDDLGLDVVDVLDAPFSPDRFVHAMSRAADRHAADSGSPFLLDTVTRRQIDGAFVLLAVDGSNVRIPRADILYAESLGEQIRVVTRDASYTADVSLDRLARVLPPAHFPRIHPSHLVALSKIETVDADVVHVGGAVLPIGPHFRRAFDDLVADYVS